MLVCDSRDRNGFYLRYVELGIAAGAAVLVLASCSHLDDLRPLLTGIDGDVRLTRLTSEGADPGRVLAAIRMFAREHGDRPTRYLQEVGWPGRPREELLEALRYEGLTCRALAGSAADVLCAYDDQLDAGVLALAEQAHPVVVRDGYRHKNARFSRAPELMDGFAPLSPAPGDASMLTFRRNQSEVREFTATRARRAGLSPDRVVDLVIAVAELAGNTMLHTESTGQLAIWSTGDEIICEVSDSGHIADALAGTIRPDPAESGSRRGLWLVHQVSDLVQARTGSAGSTVRVHFRLDSGIAAHRLGGGPAGSAGLGPITRERGTALT